LRFIRELVLMVAVEHASIKKSCGIQFQRSVLRHRFLPVSGSKARLPDHRGGCGMNLSFRFQYLNQLIGGHFDVDAISIRERDRASAPDRRILLYLRHVFGVHVANVTARIGDFNKLGHRFLRVSGSIA
jgi:hypothetical protein